MQQRTNANSIPMREEYVKNFLGKRSESILPIERLAWTAPLFTKEGKYLPFVKGGKEGLGFARLYNYGPINNLPGMLLRRTWAEERFSKNDPRETSWSTWLFCKRGG